MRVRSVLPAILALSATVPLAASHAADPVAPRVVSQPCSLRKVCAELTRRFGHPASPPPELAEMRVVWNFAEDRPLTRTLASLAELTDTLVANSGTADKPRYSLEQRRSTAVLVAAWRREALLHSIRELQRAADDYDRGKLNPASFSPGIQRPLKREPVLCKFIRLVTPPMVDRLLGGERLHFPAESVPEADITAVSQSMHPQDDPVDGPARNLIDGHVRSARKYGLQIYFGRAPGGREQVLFLALGRSAQLGLCSLRDEELGLPNTHANPYRVLEAGFDHLPQPRLPAVLQRPISADVPLPKDRLWHTALAGLAQVSGLSVVSDAYLARASSRVWSGGAVLCRKGQTAAEALDALCTAYHCVWWEKDGTVYLRASAWPWDSEIEPTDNFVDAWSVALQQKRIGDRQLAAMASLRPRQWDGLSTLGWNSHIPAKYDRSLREFLALYRAAAPAQRGRLFGTGLPVSPEQTAAFENLFLQIEAPKGEGPVRLAFAPGFASSSPNPGTVHVTLSMVRKWSNITSPMEFGFDMPQLGDPFQ